MEKRNIDEPSTKVLSYMATVRAVSQMIEDLVWATNKLGLSKEERKEYILEITKEVDQKWVLECLDESEEELLLGGKQETF